MEFSWMLLSGSLPWSLPCSKILHFDIKVWPSNDLKIPKWWTWSFGELYPYPIGKISRRPTIWDYLSGWCYANFHEIFLTLLHKCAHITYIPTNPYQNTTSLFIINPNLKPKTRMAHTVEAVMTLTNGRATFKVALFENCKAILGRTPGSLQQVKQIHRVGKIRIQISKDKTKIAATNVCLSFSTYTSKKT